MREFLLSSNLLQALFFHPVSLHCDRRRRGGREGGRPYDLSDRSGKKESSGPFRNNFQGGKTMGPRIEVSPVLCQCHALSLSLSQSSVRFLSFHIIACSPDRPTPNERAPIWPNIISLHSSFSSSNLSPTAREEKSTNQAAKKGESGASERASVSCGVRKRE